MHAFAGTYGGWEAVENASIALAEAANLVALPGRSCANGKPVPLTDPTFQKGLAALREVSMASYKAAQEKKADAMLDIADKLTHGVLDLPRCLPRHHRRRETGGYRGSMQRQAVVRLQIETLGTPSLRRSAEGAKAGA